jgi:hypothetical protein
MLVAIPIPCAPPPRTHSLSAGADMNASDANGDTPLMYRSADDHLTQYHEVPARHTFLFDSATQLLHEQHGVCSAAAAARRQRQRQKRIRTNGNVRSSTPLPLAITTVLTRSQRRFTCAAFLGLPPSCICCFQCFVHPAAAHRMSSRASAVETRPASLHFTVFPTSLSSCLMLF